jgi:hypothetical protein
MALGTIGAKQDLLVRQSMTYGPYRVSVLDTATKQPIDLTGAVVRGQIRKLLPVQGANNDPNGDEFIVDFDVVQAPSSGLLVHQYMFSLTPTKTDSLKPGLTLKDPSGQYEYDFQVTFPDGSVRPHMYGKLTSYREVTRP